MVDFADMIETRLDEVETRMMWLASQGRSDDALAFANEYIIWAKVEPGDDYNILWMEDMNPRKPKRRSSRNPNQPNRRNYKPKTK